MKRRPVKIGGGRARGGGGKDISPKSLKPLTGGRRVITRQATTCIFVAVKNPGAVADTSLCVTTTVVYRQRDDPCYKCDRCACYKCDRRACARFRGECTVATTHPKLNRTASYSEMLDVSSLCSNRTVARTISGPLVPPYSQGSTPRARHTPSPCKDHLVFRHLYPHFVSRLTWFVTCRYENF